MAKTHTILLIFFITQKIVCQFTITGNIINSDTNKTLSGVLIEIQSLKIETKTDKNGAFQLTAIPKGKYHLRITKEKFEKQIIPIEVEKINLDLGLIFILQEQPDFNEDISIISLSDEELSEETTNTDNITGLLTATKDVFSKSAAYQWSSSFFRLKGLDSKNANILINGIEMNKIYNGRPNWNNWGGLNDVTRNQEISSGLTTNPYSFGRILGTTQITMRASEFQKRGKISYASGNNSYKHRLQGYYTSGNMKKGWSFVVSASSRLARSGYMDGTPYQANSIMTSVEKKINANHSINFTGIYSQNKRGKNAPNTKEILEIKGEKYNPYWGYQSGKIRNTRIKKVEEPFFTFNHFWKINKNTELNSNIAYQFGEITNSRLDYNGSRKLQDGSIIGGAENPDPSHYTKLPSYAIRNQTNNAYDLFRAFKKNGQLNWETLYETNLNQLHARYSIHEEVTADNQFWMNTILSSSITDNIRVNGKISYRKLQSKNYARLTDLLGSKLYLDVNPYGRTAQSKQNNLDNPNNEATANDIIKYHYRLNTSIISAFVQGQFQYRKLDGFFAAEIKQTSQQRIGLFRNGTYPENSLGKSEKKIFLTPSVKAGITYKISGRHLIGYHTGYFTKAPTLQNAFSNPRINNHWTNNIKAQKSIVQNVSYTYRGIFTQAKITGYYIGIKDANENSFFYANGLDGETSAFVQQSITGIQKQHIGLELGWETAITSSFKIFGATNFGQYTYTNNPELQIDSEEDSFSFSTRKTYLKNYKLATGPQKTYSLGFEYRSPEYWWLSITGNYFDDSYINIAALKRTSNFVLDTDGLPFNDYDPQIAKQLLQQEKFKSYFIVNAIGGKSWLIADKKYIGFFVSVNNILNNSYKTGGFEQARTSNYRNLQLDNNSDIPVFGNKYWLGRRTTYFATIYYRF